MGKFYKQILFMVIFISMIFLNYTNSYSGEMCGRFATITKPTYVYFNIPRLSSSRGLIGKRIALLNPGTRIKVCRIKYVTIGFSKFPFFRILFRYNNSIRFGWVVPKSFIMSKNREFSIVFVANRTDSLTNTIGKFKNIDDDKDSILDLPGASNLFYSVYMFLFGGVLFGMVGKTFFMYAENRFTTKELLIRFGLTFFLAPIAFGGVLQLDVEITGQKELFQQMVNAISVGFGFSSITSFKQHKDPIK